MLRDVLLDRVPVGLGELQVPQAELNKVGLPLVVFVPKRALQHKSPGSPLGWG